MMNAVWQFFRMNQDNFLLLTRARSLDSLASTSILTAYHASVNWTKELSTSCTRELKTIILSWHSSGPVTSSGYSMLDFLFAASLQKMSDGDHFGSISNQTYSYCFIKVAVPGCRINALSAAAFCCFVALDQG